MKKLIPIVLLAVAAHFVILYMVIPARAEKPSQPGGSSSVEHGANPVRTEKPTQADGRSSVERGVNPVRTEKPAQTVSKTTQTSIAEFDRQNSNTQVKGSGQVIKVLTDDNDGSRHQRFIIQLASGQTLLVAHNIDLAERINSLEVGDRIEFNGEYEWNSKGGVIHWTHRDPEGRHPSGWIKHNGHTYQ